MASKTKGVPKTLKTLTKLVIVKILIFNTMKTNYIHIDFFHIWHSFCFIIYNQNFTHMILEGGTILKELIVFVFRAIMNRFIDRLRRNKPYSTTNYRKDHPKRPISLNKPRKLRRRNHRILDS
jgi:galactitol-specific phosphotransferase system IIC component